MLIHVNASNNDFNGQSFYGVLIVLYADFPSEPIAGR